MRKHLVIVLVAVLGLILAACSPTANPTPTDVTPTPASLSSPLESSEADLARVSDEAMVVVEVTPLNLGDKSAATIDFEVAMNTHSVNLTYDLTTIATLSSDAGEQVQPTKWDGPTGGGHHVSGTLSFRALKNRGQSVTLALRGIAGVPERVFTWKVN